VGALGLGELAKHMISREFLSIGQFFADQVSNPDYS
jgi:hypothetical protein